MKIVFKKQFDKATLKIKDKKLLDGIADIIKETMEAEDLREISNLKKMSGHKTAYRIRLKNHRIGVFIENGTVEFAAFAHRKDIYKNFP